MSNLTTDVFPRINDILFLVKSLKSPNPAFNIHNYVTFNTSVTRSGTFNKLIHNCRSTSYAHNFYFNRIVRLWNSLSYIDLSLSVSTIKLTLQNFLWNHFVAHYDSDNVAHYDSDNVHTIHYLCPCNSCSHLPHCNIVNCSCKVVKYLILSFMYGILQVLQVAFRCNPIHFSYCYLSHSPSHVLAAIKSLLLLLSKNQALQILYLKYIKFHKLATMDINPRKFNPHKRYFTVLLLNSRLSIAQASSSFKRFDTHTFTYTTPTFITEVLRILTQVQLVLIDFTVN